MAGRSESEILKSFKDSVAISDDTIDVEKGPMYSLVGRPLSVVLAPTEEKVDRLEKIYSADFAKVATEEESQAFLNNWGESAGQGTPSTVRVFFMTFNRPSADRTITIPIGSLVSNYDGSLQYVTIEAASINGTLADSYFNPSRRAYEVGVQCVAVSNGSQYELPAGRVTAKVSPVPGIDAVENREKCTPGTSAETILQQIERVQEKFKGLAVNTGNGSYTRIKRYSPTAILDVKTILPSDRKLFRRISYGPAKDIYVLGQTLKTSVETFTAIGGETEITLTNVPVISINSVSINNVPIAGFTFKPDTTEELGGSARAEDKIRFPYPLFANDVVSISVSFNSLIQNVQKDVLTDSQLFNTDELAREFKKVPLKIELAGRALASYDPVNIESELKNAIEKYITLTKWQGVFYPNEFLQDIRRSVTGLTSLQLLKFQRSSLATGDIEIVQMEENEIATFDGTLTTVSIRAI